MFISFQSTIFCAKTFISFFGKILAWWFFLFPLVRRRTTRFFRRCWCIKVSGTSSRFRNLIWFFPFSGTQEDDDDKKTRHGDRSFLKVKIAKTTNSTQAIKVTWRKMDGWKDKFVTNYQPTKKRSHRFAWDLNFIQQYIFN